MTTSFPTLIALNREWAHLELTSSETVCCWAQTEPALAGCDTVSAVLDEARRHPDPVFAALLRLGNAGSGLAHRVILQSMIGLLVRLARGRAEVFEEAVGEAWLLIAEYPLTRRPTSIAANLAWALRRWAAEHGRCPSSAGVENLPTHVVDHNDPDPAATLATACQLGLIDQLTHRTLSAVYLAGKTSAQAGAELGLSAAAVRWRCSRALRSLQQQAVLLAG